MSDSPIRRTLDDREAKYGDFRKQAEISSALRDITTTGISHESMPPYMKEALMMIQHKIARIVNGDPMYEDSWVDIIGYSQLTLDRIRDDKLIEAFSTPYQGDNSQTVMETSTQRVTW